MIPNVSFGRIEAPDSRDRAFMMSAVIPEAPQRTSRYWNSSGWWGNQGPHPYCVGFSWAHWVEDGPVTHKGMAPVVPPEEIYSEAQKIDEWPGEDYEGTSVRAGAKYLQSKGTISEYRWAWDVQTIADAILTKGPVVVGTNWYYDMFEPDEKGIIKVGGQIVGGHAYLLNGVNTKKQLFRIKNSWGRNWGKKGHAYISFDDMAQLIAAQGEACLAIEHADEEKKNLVES